MVENCSAVVNVSSTTGAAGGIFGQSVSGATGVIRACLAQGTVSGVSFTGGLGGSVEASTEVRVRDCVSEATVSGVSNVGGLIGMANCGVERCMVVNADIKQESDSLEPQYSASFLTGWHASTQPSISNNMIYSGKITTTNLDNSYNIAGGEGNRESNFVSETLTINDSFRNTDNAAYDGDVVTEEQLSSQSFYEKIGFDFSETGAWEWNETRPVLKNSTVDIPEKVYVTENDVMNVGADETQRSLTWYSPASGTAKVQYAPTSDLMDGLMPADAITLIVEPTPSTIEGRNVYHTKLTGLEENTQYTYRIGSETDGWTELRTFDTSSFGEFSFLFVGDPQIGSSGDVENDKSGWKGTLEKARENFSDASFLISLGDQVDNASSETEYSGFLSTGDFKSLPMAAVVGNHDSASAIFQEHFSLPNSVENEGDTPAGGDYWFKYNNALIMCLNSNNLSTAEHRQFLRDTIEAQGADADWKVVIFHHSIFSAANHSFDDEILQRRTEYAPLLSELGIDVVLMGHDHSYTRSYMMNGVIPVIPEEGVTDSVTDPAEGQVLYITANSGSGSQYYAIQSAEFDYAAVKNQENVPNISKVDVTETSLAITTYRTSDMSVVDSFTINRTKTDPVTGVSLDKDELDMTTGDTYQLTATVTPENADDQSVTWTTDNEEVATVENGNVTAVGEGTTTITVTTADGAFTAQCTINVTSNGGGSTDTEEPVDTDKPIDTDEPINTDEPIDTDEPVDTEEATAPQTGDRALPMISTVLLLSAASLGVVIWFGRRKKTKQ